MIAKTAKIVGYTLMGLAWGSLIGFALGNPAIIVTSTLMGLAVGVFSVGEHDRM